MRVVLLSVFVLSSTTFAKPTVDPRLETKLQFWANETGKERIVLHLPGKLDTTRLRIPASQAKAAKFVTKKLSQFTKAAAAPVVEYLNTLTADDVDEVGLLWITNSIRLRATLPVIEKLKEFDSLEHIALDAALQATELDDKATGSLKVEASWAAPKTAWGVEKLGAPELWKQGFDGRKILVAVIDSGAALTHPDLVPNLWSNPGETGLDSKGKDKATNGVDDDNNGYVDDVVGYNFENKNNKPTDVDGHGSQTAGIVGGAGTGGLQTGVAPRVKMMILKSCCNSGTKIFESNTWEAMQYAVANGARVISMSLSAKHPLKPSYAKWRQASEVVLAAGVIHINSAGNHGAGNEPFNIGAPATNPAAWFHPKQTGGRGRSSMITIGATDEKDVLRDYSSTGPVTWEHIKEYADFPYNNGKLPGLIKPEVCGPSGTPSTSMDGKTYTDDFGGTSCATPHIAGVAAVVLSAVPKLTVAQMTEVLQMSALPVGDGLNNGCGTGRVDAVAAVNYARRFLQ